MSSPTNTLQLNQIIAIEKGVKGDTEKVLTNAHHGLQRTQLLTGLSRTYRPRDDEGEQLPPEYTHVQLKADDAIGNVAAALARLFDVTAAKEFTNTHAKADLVVAGQVLAKDVPATYLLFLEKQLVNIETFIRKLPVLDPSEIWHRDETTGAWRTDAKESTRTKKVPRNHVKAEATERHPAQVDVWMEDVIVGYWSTTKFSGAIPASRVNELLKRVLLLTEAVKMARERANTAPIVDPKPGLAIMGWLLG